MQQYLFLSEYYLIFLPAFLLGLLHTAMPCEDKAIFCFWSFGVTKERGKSLLVLILYGLGLMSANLAIAVITILLSLIPLILIPGFVSDPYAITFFGALSSTFVAIFFLFFVTRKDYFPHSRFNADKWEQINWEKRRTPYIFGTLAGFPPCLFELFIYSQCLIISLSYGFLEAFFTVFYFSLGTFIGLFPLALAKQGFETQLTVNTKEKNIIKRNKIFIIMIMIVILFNTIIMVLSFLRVRIFPVQDL